MVALKSFLFLILAASISCFFAAIAWTFGDLSQLLRSLGVFLMVGITMNAPLLIFYLVIFATLKKRQAGVISYPVLGGSLGLVSGTAFILLIAGFNLEHVHIWGSLLLTFALCGTFTSSMHFWLLNKFAKDAVN